MEVGSAPARGSGRAAGVPRSKGAGTAWGQRPRVPGPAPRSRASPHSGGTDWERAAQPWPPEWSPSVPSQALVRPAPAGPHPVPAKEEAARLGEGRPRSLYAPAPPRPLWSATPGAAAMRGREWGGCQVKGSREAAARGTGRPAGAPTGPRRLEETGAGVLVVSTPRRPAPLLPTLGLDTGLDTSGHTRARIPARTLAAGARARAGFPGAGSALNWGKAGEGTVAFEEPLGGARWERGRRGDRERPLQTRAHPAGAPLRLRPRERQERGTGDLEPAGARVEPLLSLLTPRASQLPIPRELGSPAPRGAAALTACSSEGRPPGLGPACLHTNAAFLRMTAAPSPPSLFFSFHHQQIKISWEDYRKRSQAGADLYSRGFVMILMVMVVNWTV